MEGERQTAVKEQYLRFVPAGLWKKEGMREFNFVTFKLNLIQPSTQNTTVK